MRYETEVWSYFIRFVDEKRLIEYKKSKGREHVLAFGEMSDETFDRMLNTYCWLVKYNSYTIRFSFEITLRKPTNEEILEILDYIEKDASGLLDFAKQYADKEIRAGIRKKARKELACVAYYHQLIEADYFKDKELRDWKPIDLSDEEVLEIPNIN